MEYEPSSPVVADEKSELSVLSIEESSLRDGIENIKISGAHDTNENGDLSAEEDRPTHKENVPENIILKKLNKFVGFANLPQQFHARSIKKGFSFNLMVIGESGLGKSTLINTLFNTNTMRSKPISSTVLRNDPNTPSIEIRSQSMDFTEEGVLLHLNVVDAPGFGDRINNENCWKPILKEIEERFDHYLEAESGSSRADIKDERIHALLYFIEPTGHSLTALDIQAMKQLCSRVNIIPVIAKADTLTGDDMIEFKNRVMADVQHNQIDIWEIPLYDNDDEETRAENEEIAERIPFAVVASTDEFTTADGRYIRGRKYPWGIVNVDDPSISDFPTLKQMLIRTHMEELKETTSTKHYEQYRTERLLQQGFVQDPTAFETLDPAKKMAMRKYAHEQRLAKLEAEMRSVFSQKVKEKETKLQQSEDDLIAKHREMKKTLESQKRELELQKERLEHISRGSADGVNSERRLRGLFK